MRKYCAVCALLVLLLLLCSCQNAAEAEWILSLPEENPALAAEPELVSYPIATTEAISIFMPGADGMYSLLEQAEHYTGISVEYHFAPINSYSGELITMLMAEDAPDLFYGRNGVGIYALLDYGDEPALDMTDAISRCAPNYMAAIKADPVLSQTAFDGEYGEMFAFYQIPEGTGTIDFGPYIRADWLEALDMDIPQTYEEYHDVLVAFRDVYGCEQAFALQPTGAMPGDYLATGFGVTAYTNGSDMSSVGFYLDNGKVKYGPAEPGFLEYVTLLRQWYEEKLFTSDFLFWTDINEYGRLILHNNTGLFYANTSRATGLARNITGGGTVVPIPDAALEPGAASHLAHQQTQRTGSPTFSVFAKSSKADLCVRWCDFWYSEQGKQLVNYGTTEQIAPEEVDQSMRCALLPGIYEQRLLYAWADETVRTATDVWGENRDSLSRIPADLQMSEKDQQRFAILSQGLTTAVNIWSTRVITGDDSLDTYDAYLKQLNDYGLQKCIDALQTYVDTMGIQ